MKPHDEARPSNKICGPKLHKTPWIDRIKNHPKIGTKIAKMKRIASMGDHTQERNHSYINIIEVMKIKGTHTTLSPLMKLYPNLARVK